MDTATVNAKSKQEAIKKCSEERGFTPDAIRRVESGSDKVKSWLCFESASDAETWDKQK